MSPGAYAAAFAVGLVIAIVVFLAITSYNAVMALRQRIDKAWANIDVVLKQRYDQLPALVAAVRARAAYSPTEPIPEQAVHAEETSRAVRSLFAVVEANPQVRSDANVLDLQNEIERLEGMIADRRELYNDQVYRYNARISTLPTLLLAPLFGWRQRQFFAAEPAETVRPATEL